VALGFVEHHRRPHRDAAERDVRVGPEVVEPPRVAFVARPRGDDRDPVAVVEIDDRVASNRAGLRASGLEQRGGKDHAHTHAAARHPQQIGIDLPDDLGRQEPTQASAGDRRIATAEQATRAVRIDVLEPSGQSGTKYRWQPD
jgi:hypothetical protein